MRILPSLTTFLILTLAFSLRATEYQSAEAPGSLTVKGDSTLHEWEATTSSIEGGLTLENDALSALQVSIPVKTLKSGKDGLDDKMYDAMKTGKFPKVEFALTKSEVPEKAPEGMEGDVRLLTGKLTILDTTKTITVPVTLETRENGQIILSGSRNLDMTDFDVKPPKAMLGMVKAHPGVTVEFKWTLDKKDQPK